MNTAMVGVGYKAQGEKVFFEYDLLKGDHIRNEEWAIQQQALCGFKQKQHGFFDFGVHNTKVEGVRSLKWWCFKEPQNVATLAPYRKKEQEKKEAVERERQKKLEEERLKKEADQEKLKRNKPQKVAA